MRLPAPSRQKVIEYGKIVAAMSLAWVIASLLVRHVFLNYTPDVRDNFPGYVAMKTRDAVDITRRRLGWEAPELEQNATLEDLRMRAEQIVPGVRASYYGTTQYVEMDLEVLEFREEVVEMPDGTTRTVEVPSHVDGAPPASFVEFVEGR